jgi:hypothetical protein
MCEVATVRLREDGQDGSARQVERPIFIIGVMNRSGTNFLGDALQLLPEFEMPRLEEDYVLEHSHLLRAYTEQSAHRWHRLGSEAPSEMLRAIGAGILTFLRNQAKRADSRLVLKTPRPYGLQNFPDLFPNAKLLLLLRDGRDIVESAARSFTYASHTHWMKQWRDGARMINAFTKGPYGPLEGKSWKLIRYEDLIANSRATISDVLKFLDVSDEQFDWDRFDRLPLRGSSTVRGGAAEIHWNPVARPSHFNPIGRWSTWGYWRRRQFKRIAGRELIAQGYVSDNGW